MPVQKIRRRKLGEILVSEGLITPDQLTTALDQQGTTRETIGEVLLRQGIVIETDIVRAICIQYHLPFIHPTHYEITGSLLERFGPEFLYRNCLLPLDQIGSCFLIALGDIPNETVETQLEAELGEDLYYYFAPSSEIQDVLREHFTLTQEQILQLNSDRDDTRQKHPGSSKLSASSGGHDNLLEALDHSWEAIFDEAEQNLGP